MGQWGVEAGGGGKAWTFSAITKALQSYVPTTPHLLEPKAAAPPRAHTTCRCCNLPSMPVLLPPPPLNELH